MAAHRKFHGITLKSRRAGGFSLREIQHPPGVFIPRHSHEHAHVGFILDGGFTETFTRKTLECRPLSVSYIAPGLPHTDDFRHGVHCLVVEIAPALLERVRPLLALDEPIFVRSGAPAWLMLRMCRAALQSDTASSLTIEGLALEILTELAAAKAQVVWKDSPAWIEQARDLLHARFTETLTHDEIAGRVGVHPVHLATVFRRKFGCTIGEYVRRLRIEQAALQISNSGHSLADIAWTAGFSDQSHFSKVFKSHTGMTPGAFRATLPGRSRPAYLRPLNKTFGAGRSGMTQ
jgi:AraC family transcriptional regulator